MTAEEKAKEIIDKFTIGQEYNAILCANILCDEMIDFLFKKRDSDYVFWQEVKQAVMTFIY